MGEQTTQPAERQTQKGGKYLTFILADEEYGLEILKVREIISMMDITAVPCTPEYVKGVINLRGRVIPVADLRLKFGMEEAERTKETCIIVLTIGNAEMGIIVDRVSEVLDIAGEDIEETPSFGCRLENEFILGVAKSGRSVTILLDIERVLDPREAAALAGAVGSGQAT